MREKEFAIWVAHGAGTADRTVIDWRDGLDVPPANPMYRLRPPLTRLREDCAAMLDLVGVAIPWSSRLLSSLHVTRVSSEWLRMHELESGKRGTD